MKGGGFQDGFIGWDDDGKFIEKDETYDVNATCFRVVLVVDFFSHGNGSMMCCRHEWNGLLGHSSVVVDERPDLLISDDEIAWADVLRAAHAAKAKAREAAKREAAQAAQCAREEQERLCAEAALADLGETPEVKAAWDAQEIWMGTRCHHNGIMKVSCRVCRDAWELARPCNPHGERPFGARGRWPDRVVCDCGLGCNRASICQSMLRARQVGSAQP